MKVQMKYIKGITDMENSFECETENDCARGLLNILYGYPVEDVAMDDAALEILGNPKYYPEGNVGDLRRYIVVLGERFENLKFVSIDSDVIVKK